ncbi:MAG: zinc-ribbon domain-containing protein [Calditrichaeota bacterium]|nr:MAG: zinc-ribbon domain-containing protein [Calditrichota bacterium]
MNCPNCGNEVSQEAKFCPNCGEKLEPRAAESKTVCTECGAALRPGAKFCHACGAPVENIDAEKVYEADWDDIELEGARRRSPRNLRATLLPILVIPVLVAVFFMLSRNQKVSQENAPPAQNPANMKQMEQVFAQIDSLRETLKKNPQDTTALLVLGEMYEIASRFDEARDYYTRYLKINADNLDVQMRVANIYFRQKNYAAAEDLLKKVLAKQPNNAYALFNYALTLHFIGDIDGAIANWKKAIQADPNGEIGKQAMQAIQTAEKLKTQK